MKLYNNPILINPLKYKLKGMDKNLKSEKSRNEKLQYSPQKNRSSFECLQTPLIKRYDLISFFDQASPYV